ncbi:MAG: hypothetical protein QXU32_07785 [Nitrososphaerales archaeon]
MNKYVTYIMMGLLIASGALITKAAYAQTWYPGDNLQQDLLVKYRISHFDYKRGTPFDVTLWFGSQDNRNNWITNVIVEEKGQVATGQLTLSSITLTPLGAEVSEEIRPYREAIKDSLSWLGSYSSKIDPKPLRVNQVWGVIAAIGGGSITVQPIGTETIQAAGQSWDTYVIGWRYGADSKIWVKDDFPLPIRAKVFALTTQQPIPVQFELELLETRMSDTPPVPPEEKPEIPTPPLSTTTTSAIFNVDLYWDPIEIRPDQVTQFGVVIFDQQKRLVDSVRYIFKVEDAKGNVLINNEFLTKAGQGTHEITFQEAGRTHVTVTVLRELPGVAEPIREVANFEIIVVPEFPLGLALVMASIVAMMVAMTRFKLGIARP